MSLNVEGTTCATRSVPTVHDVANASGVSTATVSRVINNFPGVSPQVQENVLRAIRLLRYEPNLSAKRLGTLGGKSRRKARSIGG